MQQVLASITSNTEIMPGIHLMWMEAPNIAATAQPGQFITVQCEDCILRRPFSIHQVVVASEAKQSQIALLFKVVGKGTLWLSQRQSGDKVDVLGPLGKGFSLPSVIARRPERQRRNLPRQSKNLLLVAGGVGIAPLIFLAQNASSQHSIILIHGALTARELYPLSLLPEIIQFVPVTEDGSVGKKGLATDVLPDFLDWADQIYACGPIDMYKQLAADSYQLKATTCHSEPSAPCRSEGALRCPCHSEHSEESQRSGQALRPKNLTQDKSKLKKCQVSLEVRMGCGSGACYGCTINTKKGLKQVCRDGPVFELDDIIWEEVRI